MIKVISAARRNPALSSEEFQRRMREEHAPLVARLPRLGTYVVNFALSGTQSPWDVVVELTFPELAAFQAALSSEPGQAALSHMRELVDMSSIQSGTFEPGPAAGSG